MGLTSPAFPEIIQLFILNFGVFQSEQSVLAILLTRSSIRVKPRVANRQDSCLAGMGSSFEYEDRGDLIKFYNSVYVKKMKNFAKKFSMQSLERGVSFQQCNMCMAMVREMALLWRGNLLCKRPYGKYLKRCEAQYKQLISFFLTSSILIYLRALTSGTFSGEKIEYLHIQNSRFNLSRVKGFKN